MKKDRATVSDEQREQQLIAEQISRAAMEDDSKKTNDSSSTPPVEEGLKRDETSEKVVLSFSAKPVASSGSTAVVDVVFTGMKMNTFKAAVNPLKANPLRRPHNALKSFSALASSESDVTRVNEKKRPAPMSATERLITEEQEGKRRRMDRDDMV